jgi:hypothetical protein
MAAFYRTELEKLVDLMVPPAPALQPLRVIWIGASGTRYSAELYPIGTTFHRIPGIYIFCQIASLTTWRAVYVGQTDDLDRRLREELAHHHRWQSIRAAGATHVGVIRVSGSLDDRLRIETDLRRGLNPPCNRQIP